MMTLPQGVDPDLWAEAARLRKKYWGNDVFLRGIVEFSNRCGQNCLYCGLRRENSDIERYRLDMETIFDAARAVRDLGFGTVVLQAGEDAAGRPEDMAGLIVRLKKKLGLAVTLSLGEHSREVYALWRKAGADRYLLKLETLAQQPINAELLAARTLQAHTVTTLRAWKQLGK